MTRRFMTRRLVLAIVAALALVATATTAIARKKKEFVCQVGGVLSYKEGFRTGDGRYYTVSCSRDGEKDEVICSNLLIIVGPPHDIIEDNSGGWGGGKAVPKEGATKPLRAFCGG